MHDGRWLIGRGMATANYPMNYAPASAKARLLPDGTAEVASAASDMGPGTWTSMTQVAAETLGLPVERLKFTLGDTRLPRAAVHGGSMTMASVGSTVQAACQKAREIALARSSANDLGDAMRGIGQVVEPAADVKPGDAGKRFSMHAFGAIFVEVAVDPDLGETGVRRIAGAYGAGRIVDPKAARSQCIGGMIGRIGMAHSDRRSTQRTRPERDPGRICRAGSCRRTADHGCRFRRRARPACQSARREGRRRNRQWAVSRRRTPTPSLRRPVSASANCRWTGSSKAGSACRAPSRAGCATGTGNPRSAVAARSRHVGQASRPRYCRPQRPRRAVVVRRYRRSMAGGGAPAAERLLCTVVDKHLHNQGVSEQLPGTCGSFDHCDCYDRAGGMSLAGLL